VTLTFATRPVTGGKEDPKPARLLGQLPRGTLVPSLEDAPER
jgi:hypothetical protein